MNKILAAALTALAAVGLLLVGGAPDGAQVV
jgi:hypothetical protein